MDLETVVRHEGRLNVLCCLLDYGNQSASQLAARTGDSMQAVGYWIKVLQNFGLVVQVAEIGQHRQRIYSASLDGQPQWVLEAVQNHRPRTV